MKRVTPQRQSALLMAAYAMLLVVGAALPMAVSYAQSATHATQGRIQCGGFNRRAESTVEATDEAETRTRPLARHARTAAPVSGARIASSEALCHDGLDHSRFRGS